MDTEITERQKYIEGLQGKISKAVAARKFNESDEGKLIREWASEQVNLVLKQLAGQKFMNDHNGYVYATGQLAMAQKLIVMLDSAANTDTTQLTENLKAAKTDGQ